MSPRAGFTLVEVLVAVAIMGMILAAVGTISSGTVRFADTATSSAQRVQVLSDVSGYVGDITISAAEVVTAAVSLPGGAPCGTVLPDADGRISRDCLALLMPVLFDENAEEAADIVRYDAVALFVAPRSTLPVSDRPARAHSGDATPYLFIVVEPAGCGPAELGRACGVPSFPDLSDGDPHLVVENLYFDPTSPTPVFAVETGAETVAIRLRVADVTRAGQLLTPPQGVASFLVSRRN